MLTAIKLFHTVVWAILAGSIGVLPLTGVMRRFRWAAILTGLVLLECGLLGVNGGRCPLSDLASGSLTATQTFFDIYLPNRRSQCPTGGLFDQKHDPVPPFLASLLLLTQRTSLKESLSHLSVAPSGHLRSSRRSHCATDR